jgi:hypothetical protein
LATTVFLFLLSAAIGRSAQGVTLLSGISGPIGRDDIDAMESAFKNTTVGPGISGINTLENRRREQS